MEFGQEWDTQHPPEPREPTQAVRTGLAGAGCGVPALTPPKTAQGKVLYNFYELYNCKNTSRALSRERAAHFWGIRWSSEGIPGSGWSEGTPRMGHVPLHGRGWVRVALGQQELGREVGFEEREFLQCCCIKRGTERGGARATHPAGNGALQKLRTPAPGLLKPGVFPVRPGDSAWQCWESTSDTSGRPQPGQDVRETGIWESLAPLGPRAPGVGAPER